VLYTINYLFIFFSLYTFDTRNLKKPVNVHMDHVGAVTYIDYAPTGREFVSGSYDKSIRIFETNKGHSREIYHTKRMQRLTCVQWTLDNKYILSGSDEMNIRIWKARASEKLGPVSLLTICNSLFFLIIFIF
jgi:WD repeat and SOF domain-containing protein 1